MEPAGAGAAGGIAGMERVFADEGAEQGEKGAGEVYGDLRAQIT